MEMRVTLGSKTRRVGHDDGYTPVPHPFGYELSGLGETWQGPLFLGVFGTVWLVGTGFALLAVRREGVGAFVFVAVAAVVILLLIFLATGKTVSARLKWESSRLILEEWPLAIGSSTVVWFGRPLAKSTTTPRPRDARLILRESATYRVGTDTRTATSDLLKVPLSLTDRSMDGISGYETELVIPPDGPPTIQLDSNLVEWIVEFELDAPRAPATTSRFTVLVSPEIAATP